VVAEFCHADIVARFLPGLRERAALALAERRGHDHDEDDPVFRKSPGKQAPMTEPSAERPSQLAEALA